MFNDFINSDVLIIVATKSETFFEYSGVLVAEDDKFIKLKKATINKVMLSFEKNIFGGDMGSYKDNVGEIIINKDYIISCNKD